MEEAKINYGEALHAWIVPEYVQHDRSRLWYIIASVVGFILIIYSFFSANFLFAVIIIVGALIIIIHDGQKPAKVKVTLTNEGVVIGRNFYEYGELKNFATVEKKNENIKNLYFEFKSALHQRLSIPLDGIEPNDIKTTLLKYLPLDKERTDIPVSEQLSRLLKL